MEELYINEQKIDIDDALITLKYNSNFWGDIDALLSSHSYTIECQKTANNTQIFAQSDMPSQATSNRILRRYNNAKYYRNGIEIFVGKAIMLEATAESFNIFLKWGELEELVTFLNESVNLNEPFDQSFQCFGIRIPKATIMPTTAQDFFLTKLPPKIQNYLTPSRPSAFQKYFSLSKKNRGCSLFFHHPYSKGCAIPCYCAIQKTIPELLFKNIH